MKNHFSLFLLLFSTLLYADELETLFESQSDEQDSELYQTVQYYIDNPLDINGVSEKDLHEVPFISKAMVQDILIYRLEHNGFQSVEDLKEIKSVRPVADILVHFFTIEETHSKQFKVRARDRYSHPVEKSKAFLENKYRGNADKLYNRVDVIYGDVVKAGVVAEKDAGEASVADYLGMYAQYTPLKSPVQIVLGNYIVKSGQGLVFWGPYKMYKGFDPIVPAIKPESGLKPSLSVDENASLYGVGASLPIHTIKLTGFYSNRKIDASLENGKIKSFHSTGYHRFGSEWEFKDAVNVSTQGAVVEWNPSSAAQVGANCLMQQFDKPFMLPVDSFNDKKSATSVYYNLDLQNLSFFGEGGVSNQTGKGVVSGFMLNENRFQAVGLYRNYNQSFHSPFGRAFGDNYTPNNERGVYWGWKWIPRKHTFLTLSFDSFRHPVFDEKSTGESWGKEWMIGFEQAVRNFKIQARLKSTQKELFINVDDAWGNKIRKQNVKNLSSFRLQISYKAKNMEMKSRIAYNRLGWDYLKNVNSLTDSSSILLFHDIRYKPEKHLDLRTRWSFFDAPLYDLRFYQFENDLAGVMKLQMLQDRGVRWYAVAGIKLGKIKLSLKYEITRYDNLVTVGTGDNLVLGDHISKISVQMDWKNY